MNFYYDFFVFCIFSNLKTFKIQNERSTATCLRIYLIFWGSVKQLKTHFVLNKVFVIYFLFHIDLYFIIKHTSSDLFQIYHSLCHTISLFIDRCCYFLMPAQGIFFLVLIRVNQYDQFAVTQSRWWVSNCKMPNAAHRQAVSTAKQPHILGIIQTLYYVLFKIISNC